MPRRLALSPISNCRQLSELTLNKSSNGVPLRFQADGAAIGALAQLTRRAFQCGWDWRAAAGACTALARLDVAAEEWRPACLPALCQLSGLTTIRGAWTDGPGSAAVEHPTPAGTAVACQSVVAMHGVAGVPPFEAFPNLRVLSHDDVVGIQAGRASQCTAGGCVSC